MSRFEPVDAEEYARLRIRVKDLEEKVKFLLNHLSLEYFSPDSEDFDDLRQLAASGQVLEAIKQYRQRTGSSLQAAKEYFEG